MQVIKKRLKNKTNKAAGEERTGKRKERRGNGEEEREKGNKKGEVCMEKRKMEKLGAETSLLGLDV